MTRDIEAIDDDLSRKKRQIKDILIADPDVVELLNDPDVDPSCPEELWYSSIFPFARIPGVQDKTKNFISYSVSEAVSQYNDVNKHQVVVFTIFVHKDNIKTRYGVARHDLLGYVLRDIFHLSNKLGAQMNLIQNQEGCVDVDYTTRTLKFELVLNNSTKTARSNPHEFGTLVK